MTKTSIEWTEQTWNPIVGCSIVSPGCTNCYAMNMAARIEAMNEGLPAGHRHGGEYIGTTKKVNGKAVWTGKMALADERKLLAPLRRKKPTMYFVNSMGDLFHEDIPDEWIDKVFAVMALCPQHTFQVLTKRSARMRSYFSPGRRDAVFDAAGAILKTLAAKDIRSLSWNLPAWPLPNVWLGVSTEDQRRADERIPDLLATQAAIRFISAEPLLGPIDLTRIAALKDPEDPEAKWFFDALATGDMYEQLISEDWEENKCYDSGDGPYRETKLDWVIVGGESGPGARPMHPDWARSLRDHCAAAGVKFFFKQWGAWRPEVFPGVEVDLTTLGKGEKVCANPSEPGTHVRYFNVGKIQAGRLLDGVEYNGMPEARP